eukprot:gene17317-19866_t
MVAMGSLRGSYVDCPIGTYQPYGEGTGQQNCACLPCDQGYTAIAPKKTKKEDCFPENSRTPKEKFTESLEYYTRLSLFTEHSPAEYSALLSLTPVSSLIQTGIESILETKEIGRTLITQQGIEYPENTTEYSARLSITPVSRTRNLQIGLTTITEIIEYSPVTTEYSAHLLLTPVSSSPEISEYAPISLTPNLIPKPMPTGSPVEKPHSMFTVCVPGMTAIGDFHGPYYVDCPVGTWFERRDFEKL